MTKKREKVVKWESLVKLNAKVELESGVGGKVSSRESRESETRKGM